MRYKTNSSADGADTYPHIFNQATFKYGQSTRTSYDLGLQDPSFYNYGWYIAPNTSTSYSEAPLQPANDLIVWGRPSGNTKYITHYVEAEPYTVPIVTNNHPIRPDYVFYGSAGLRFMIDDAQVPTPEFVISWKINCGKRE